jgi:COP9 signalosome complex subunit 8
LPYVESYRKRIFELLTSAYSTISVADVAHFMGMSEEDATNCMF